MSDETKQLIAIAIATLAQVYVTDPLSVHRAWARVLDIIATFCGQLASVLARFSMIARQEYFTVVNTYGT